MLKVWKDGDVRTLVAQGALQLKVVLKVFKWDNDLAVELPQELVDQLALKEGDELEIVAAVAAESAEARMDSGEREGVSRPSR